MLSKSGIYKITNLETNEIYVGSSVNIERRWGDHKTRMKKKEGKEYNKELYVALRKYGIENFSIEIIEECPKELFIEKESFWIKKLDTINNGYNGYGLQKHHKAKVTKKDVIEIRTRYQNKEKKAEVFSDYKNYLSKSGFNKIWLGVNWGSIMPEVFTEEIKEFHKKNSGNDGEKNGMARLTEKEIKEIKKAKQKKEDKDKVYENYKKKITIKSFLNIWYGYTWKHIIV